MFGFIVEVLKPPDSRIRMLSSCSPYFTATTVLCLFGEGVETLAQVYRSRVGVCEQPAGETEK